jgi:DNA-binding transcriptional LysR family regulator
MNFTQLDSFIAAAEYLNFTRAAERLYLSQPVLSRHISTLEKELGIKLFEREKKAVRLTPAGKIMYTGAVRIMHEYKTLVDDAIVAQGEYSTRLTIGFVEGQLFTDPFSAPLDAFRAVNPDVQINLKLFTIKGIKDALLGGEIDVAMVAKFKNIEQEPNVDYLEVGKTTISMVIPKNHPLASQKRIRIGDLKNENILVLAQNEALFETTDIVALLAKLGDFPFSTTTVSDVGALALSLEAGYGIAPINANHALQNNAKVVFIPIDGFADTTETVVWKRSNTNPAVRLLVKAFAAAAETTAVKKPSKRKPREEVTVKREAKETRKKKREERGQT